MKKLQEIFDKLKSNALDYYVTSLVVVGLPLVVLAYTDVRLAVLTHIVVVTIYGVLVAVVEARKARGAE